MKTTGWKAVIFGVAAGVVLVAGCGGCQPSATVSQPTPAPRTATAGAAGAAAATRTVGPKYASEDDIVVIFGDGEPDVGPAPLTVEFSISDPFMRLKDPTFEWDFGDGSPRSNQRRPKHTYVKPGKYVAKVVVQDVADSDSDTVEIQVTEPAAGGQ